MVPSSPTCNVEVPTKIIRVHRSLITEDMIEIFLDPSILKFNLNANIIGQHDIEEAGQGNGVLREVLRFFCFGKIVMSHTCWESVRGFPTSGMILTEKRGRQCEGYLLRDILIANSFPLR